MTRLPIVLALLGGIAACSPASAPAPETIGTTAQDVDPALRELLKDVPVAALTDPLLVAVAKRDAAGVRAAFASGRSLDDVHFGPLLLEIAAGADDCEPAVLDALIDNGADPDPRDALGTPLHAAAAFANAACFDTLLAHGADPARVDANGHGVVTEALFSQDAAFFAAVLARPLPKSPDDLATALQVALAKDDCAAYRALVAAGADPQRPVHRGVSAATSKHADRIARCDATPEPADVRAAADDALADDCARRSGSCENIAYVGTTRSNQVWLVEYRSDSHLFAVLVHDDLSTEMSTMPEARTP